MSISRTQTGFTLIEVMIVIGIIGILAAITIPAYREYIKNAQDNSCLAEAKSYSNHIYNILNDQNGSIPPAPIIKACHSISNAIGWTLDTQQKIIAITKPPSNKRIECDIPNGSPCRLLP